MRLVLAAVLIAASATYPARAFDIPETLDDKGMVIAILPSRLFLAAGMVLGDPVISGKRYSRTVKTDRMAVILPPGEYELESLLSESNEYYGGAGVPLRKKSTKTFRIGRRFRVEKGRVTSLGVIAPVRDFKDASRIKLFNLDNSGDLKPLVGERLIKDPGPYLEAEKHKALRSTVARFRFVELAPAGSGDILVSDEIGTLGTATVDDQGQSKSFRSIESGTFEDLTDRCAMSGGRVACVIGDRLVMWSDGKRKEQKIPAGFERSLEHSLLYGTKSVFLFAASGVVLLDSRLVVHLSRDDGATWERFEGIAEKSAAKAAGKGAWFSAGEKGFYLSGPVGQLFFSPYERMAFEKLELPKLTEFRQVVETRAGALMAWPVRGWNYYELHVGRPGEKKWDRHKVSMSSCGPLAVASDESLAVRCGVNRQRLVSKDGGKTWGP